MITHTVYIIKSDKGYYYIGQTQDFSDRLHRHNTNRSKATKNKGKWDLVVSLGVNSRSEAMKLESKLKRMKNSQKAIEYFKRLVLSIPTKSGGS